MDIKSAPFTVKAAGPDDGLEEGQFVGYASAFGNADSYGDVVQPGAFKKTLEEWAAKGATIPVLWGHDMSDPFANIGGVISAEEDEAGLKVTAQLDMDNPTAVQVYRLLKGRRIDTMSFAYSVRDSEQKDGLNHLLDLKVYEVSVVHVPANDQAQILAVKSAADALMSKAGRVLSAKNEKALRMVSEQLTAASEQIKSVLAAVDGDEAKSQGNQASGTSDANADASAEEPPVANASVSAEEQKSAPSVSDLAAKLRIYALMGQEERV